MNTDVENYISNFTENDIVVFINHYNIYDFLLKDKNFKWENKNNLIGETSKKAMIFSFGDPYDKGKRIIVIDKRDISKLSININDNDFGFIDLNSNDGLVKEIITKETYLLPHKSEEEQISFLKKQVEISMCGNFSFHSKNTIRIRRILYKD